MAAFKKPEVPEVYEFLRGHNALIVHFSGTPKGAGSNFEHLYPADLQSVVNLEAMGGVSCSVVRPDDEFSDLERANATGCIGVVLGLRDKDSLVAVHPHDCGSFVEDGVRKVPNERNLTIDDLEETFVNRPRGSYNEWIIKNYIVLGIFAAPPFRVSNLCIPRYLDDMPDYLKDGKPAPDFEYVTVPEIQATFSDLLIFGFRNGDLVCLTDEEGGPLDHTTIY